MMVDNPTLMSNTKTQIDGPKIEFRHIRFERQCMDTTPMLAEPKCFTRRCRHFHGVKYMDPAIGEESEWLICAAFPDGIPDERML